jgi:uncharacterized repeat protein (TIGR01451 family)
MLVAAALVAPADPAAAQNWTVTKTPSPTTYSAAGQTITYTFVVTNNGTGADDDIYNISLTDNVLGAISCPRTTLTEGGDSMTCVASYTTTTMDVANGSLTNTVTANGEHSSDMVPTQRTHHKFCAAGRLHHHRQDGAGRPRNLQLHVHHTRRDKFHAGADKRRRQPDVLKSGLGHLYRHRGQPAAELGTRLAHLHR